MEILDNNIFEQNKTLILNPLWILKGDGDKVVLYLLSLEVSTNILLDLQDGIILSLFNGSRSIKEIVKSVEMISNCTNDLALSYVTMLLMKLSDENINSTFSEYPVFINASPKSEHRHDLDPVTLIDSLYTVSDLSSTTSTTLPRNVKRLNSPINIGIFFTNLCSTDCRYCYAERRLIPKSDWLTLGDWREIIKQVCELGIKKVDVLGGDVFARKDGIEFIELLLEYNLLFMISTKCLITKEYAKRLVNAGFCKKVNNCHRIFQYSLDSCDPNIASFLTKTPDFLNRATESISNLIEAGIYPRVKAVITPYNSNGIELFIRKMVDLGVNEIHFTFYDPTSYRHTDDLALSYIEKKQFSSKVRSLKEKFPSIKFGGNAFNEPLNDNIFENKIKKWESRSCCSGGRTSLLISADGKALICEQTPQDFPFIFGDVKKSSITDIWNSQELLEFIFPSRDEFIGTVCYDCVQFDSCKYEKGCCFRDAYFATKNPFDAPPSCPYIEKSSIKSSVANIK